MSEQPEREPRDVSPYRYPLAVLACALTLAVWVPLFAALAWAMFHYLGDWVDRQVWLIRVVLQCGLGLVLIGALAAGWAITSGTWQYITRRVDTPRGQKHGRHARWYAGRPKDEPPPTGEGEGGHGRCPKCEFSYEWDGVSCGHCGYERRT